MQVLSNFGKHAMVVGNRTRTVLVNSNHRWVASLTQINSSSLYSLHSHFHADASSGICGGSTCFPIPKHRMMSGTCFSTEAKASNGNPTGRLTAAIATADACDANAALLASGDLRALEPIFNIYGQRRAFSGPIVNLKVFEDNVIVRQLLETRGEGRIVVIDGGGSKRCALIGGNLAQIAQTMGWAGIVVNGCVRDVDEINAFDIGVRALGSNPLKTNKNGVGDKHVPVRIAGTLIRDGEWLYADSDGILISKMELSI